MKGVVGVITLLVVLAMTRPSYSAITCGQVNSMLAPCLAYLTNGGTPSGSCCTGVGNLKSLTDRQPADRRSACECVKAAAQRNPNIKADAASDLPRKCNVPTNIPISPTVDCSSI